MSYQSCQTNRRHLGFAHSHFGAASSQREFLGHVGRTTRMRQNACVSDVNLVSRIPSMDDVNPTVVRKWIEEGQTFENVSVRLQMMLPGRRRISDRSVRRFCRKNGISFRSNLTQTEVDRLVYKAVQEVGQWVG